MNTRFFIKPYLANAERVIRVTNANAVDLFLNAKAIETVKKAMDRTCTVMFDVKSMLYVVDFDYAYARDDLSTFARNFELSAADTWMEGDVTIVDDYELNLDLVHYLVEKRNGGKMSVVIKKSKDVNELYNEATTLSKRISTVFINPRDCTVLMTSTSSPSPSPSCKIVRKPVYLDPTSPDAYSALVRIQEKVAAQSKTSVKDVNDVASAFFQAVRAKMKSHEKNTTVVIRHLGTFRSVGGRPLCEFDLDVESTSSILSTSWWTCSFPRWHGSS